MPLHTLRLTCVVAGDHFSLIRPDSPNHESYLTLKKDLLEMLEGLDLTQPRKPR